eukprot:Opistho-2@79847
MSAACAPLPVPLCDGRVSRCGGICVLLVLAPTPPDNAAPIAEGAWWPVPISRLSLIKAEEMGPGWEDSVHAPVDEAMLVHSNVAYVDDRYMPPRINVVGALSRFTDWSTDLPAPPLHPALPFVFCAFGRRRAFSSAAEAEAASERERVVPWGISKARLFADTSINTGPWLRRGTHAAVTVSCPLPRAVLSLMGRETTDDRSYGAPETHPLELFEHSVYVRLVISWSDDIDGDNGTMLPYSIESSQPVPISPYKSVDEHGDPLQRKKAVNAVDPAWVSIRVPAHAHASARGTARSAASAPISSSAWPARKEFGACLTTVSGDDTIAIRLVEWMEFALRMGASHVFLYVDDSKASASVHAVAEHYRKRGVATAIEWHFPPLSRDYDPLKRDAAFLFNRGQLVVANDCLQRARIMEIELVQFADLDEYLAPGPAAREEERDWRALFKDPSMTSTNRSYMAYGFQNVLYPIDCVHEFQLPQLGVDANVNARAVGEPRLSDESHETYRPMFASFPERSPDVFLYPDRSKNFVRPIFVHFMGVQRVQHGVRPKTAAIPNRRVSAFALDFMRVVDASNGAVLGRRFWWTTRLIAPFPMYSYDDNFSDKFVFDVAVARNHHFRHAYGGSKICPSDLLLEPLEVLNRAAVEGIRGRILSVVSTIGLKLPGRNDMMIEDTFYTDQ